jgi:predicted DNA repair protein MutK
MNNLLKKQIEKFIDSKFFNINYIFIAACLLSIIETKSIVPALFIGGIYLVVKLKKENVLKYF